MNKLWVKIFFITLGMGFLLVRAIPQSPEELEYDYNIGKAYGIVSTLVKKIAIPAIFGVIAIPTIRWVTTNTLQGLLNAWTAESKRIIDSNNNVSNKENLKKMLEEVQSLTGTYAKIYGETGELTIKPSDTEDVL